MRLPALFTLGSLVLLPLASQTPSRPYFAEPALAPDRPEIAFVSGGDIWTVPAAGGEAHLLVSHPATESRPLYSPDGRKLAFVSNRAGSEDIYVLDFASGATTRLTYDDGSEHLDAWSRDGKYLYYSTTSHDIAGMNDIYRVSAGGGTPMPVSADRYAAEYWAAPSPADDTLAFTAKGLPAGQWWRNGHSHIDESEIWLLRNDAYERLSGGPGAKEMWPMWRPDGRRVYFVSDRSGAENLWMRDTPPGSRPRQLTTFKDGRLLWPSIAWNGARIVFERDFGIWTFDTETGKSAPVEITLRGAPASPSVTHSSASADFRDLALSPDGKKVAFVWHGDIFAASSKDGGNAVRLSATPAGESAPVWSPDSRRLVYVSDRDGSYALYQYDFAASSETRLTSDPAGDYSPRWSPDGKQIAFVRGGTGIAVYEPATKAARTLVTGHFGKPPLPGDTFSWSPDSAWIVFSETGPRGFDNLSVVPASGGEPRPITWVANGTTQAPAWCPDATCLYFATGQRTEPAAIARLDLVPRTPKFREDQFRDLFKDDSPKTAGGSDKPAKADIRFEGLRGRLRLLPLGLSAEAPRISPDGKALLFLATAAGQQNLYTYSLDELAKEAPVPRQLTSTAGAKADAQWSPDGKEIFCLEQGRVQAVTVESRQVRNVSLTAEMDIDFAREKLAVFREAWKYLDDNFYDPKFHGADWKAVRARFEPYIEGARTPDELRRLVSLMVGELNASHLGISAGGGPSPAVTGRLGLGFDRAEYETNGRLRIADVIPLGPADAAGIQTGETLLAVDGTAIDGRTSLDALLDHKVERRVLLTVAGASGRREVPLLPVGLTAEKRLRYRQWVESRREYVRRASGGRLGYVHMLDMSENALEQLHLDLDAENMSREGVVIDIRNNSGGFVNAYALDVLARRPYLTMTPRGSLAAPARNLLGQRSLERPTILLVNQHSLSDAEDFTEGYRAMKLGKVAGEPTAGWIIYTWGARLIDGSFLRLPHVRITTIEGADMERNPRPVDVPVDRRFGESYTGKDAQLDRAVSELLGQLGSKAH